MPKLGCLLCGSNADSRDFDYGRLVEYDCQKCKKYIVHGGSKNKVSDLSDEKKLALSVNSSRCEIGYVFKIYTENNAVHGGCEKE